MSLARAGRQRPPHLAMTTGRRTRDIAHLLVRVRDWAARRTDIEAVALAGSWARGDARMDSDLDLVVLCADPEPLLSDLSWSHELVDDLELLDTRSWGPLTELRLCLRDGIEIDFGVAAISWAATDPIDDGTRRVVTDGISILHDPHRHLARLIRACRTGDQ